LQGSVLVADDPAFSFISSTTLDWWEGEFSIFGADAEDDDAGNGILLAETSDGSPLLMRWEPDIEFYPGAGHTPMGFRSYIGNGGDDNDINYFGFSDASRIIFFNELHLLANPELIPDIIQVIPEDDCTLSGLVPSTGTLDPTFASDVTSYQITGLAADATVTFTATTTATSATVTGATEGGTAGSTVTIKVTDGDAECTYTIDLVTSIDDITDAGINMYPNPAKSVLTLDGLQENASIYIMNSVGQLVYQTEAFDNRLNVDVNGFNSGIYLIKVEMNGEVYTSRFIKE
jgi:hypothetical protein